MMNSLRESVGFLVGLGGPVVAVLLALSVVAVALVLLKLHQFWVERVGRHGPSREALHHWLHGRFADAEKALAGDRSAVSLALASAMRMEKARTPKPAIEEEVARIALVRLHGLQRGFRALDAIAQIAPLLGLFGTVLGMIEAFRQLQGAGNTVDPSMLAGGIWVALLTTAVGLAVAMPVSLLLTWLETRVENERVAIETTLSGFLGHLFVESRQDAADTGFATTLAERGHAH